MEGVGLYDYGARFYDPSIGRFSGVDPIAESYPHVTVYNYAENRVPNGIDLWGLQYVSMHSAQFSILSGQTWQKTNSYQAGRDAYGTQYQGMSFPISRIRFQVPRNFYTKGTYRAMNNMVKHMNFKIKGVRVAKSTGLFDKRFNSTKNYNESGRGIGRIGLVFEAIKLGKDINNTIESYKVFSGTDEPSVQLGYINNAWEGVLEGVSNGYFSEDQINLDNLSQVADYLYRGKVINNEALQSAAEKISKEILQNNQPKFINRKSGLDGFKLSPIQVNEN